MLTLSGKQLRSELRGITYVELITPYDIIEVSILRNCYQKWFPYLTTIFLHLYTVGFDVDKNKNEIYKINRTNSQNFYSYKSKVRCGSDKRI